MSLLSIYTKPVNDTTYPQTPQIPATSLWLHQYIERQTWFCYIFMLLVVKFYVKGFNTLKGCLLIDLSFPGFPKYIVGIPWDLTGVPGQNHKFYWFYAIFNVMSVITLDQVRTNHKWIQTMVMVMLKLNFRFQLVNSNNHTFMTFRFQLVNSNNHTFMDCNFDFTFNI